MNSSTLDPRSTNESFPALVKNITISIKAALILYHLDPAQYSENLHKVEKELAGKLFTFASKHGGLSDSQTTNLRETILKISEESKLGDNELKRSHSSEPMSALSSDRRDVRTTPAHLLHFIDDLKHLDLKKHHQAKESGGHLSGGHLSGSHRLGGESKTSKALIKKLNKGTSSSTTHGLSRLQLARKQSNSSSSSSDPSSHGYILGGTPRERKVTPSRSKPTSSINPQKREPEKSVLPIPSSMPIRESAATATFPSITLPKKELKEEHQTSPSLLKLLIQEFKEQFKPRRPNELIPDVERFDSLTFFLARAIHEHHLDSYELLKHFVAFLNAYFSERVTEEKDAKQIKKVERRIQERSIFITHCLCQIFFYLETLKKNTSGEIPLSKDISLDHFFKEQFKDIIDPPYPAELGQAISFYEKLKTIPTILMKHPSLSDMTFDDVMKIVNSMPIPFSLYSHEMTIKAYIMLYLDERKDKIPYPGYIDICLEKLLQRWNEIMIAFRAKDNPEMLAQLKILARVEDNLQLQLALGLSEIDQGRATESKRENTTDISEEEAILQAVMAASAKEAREEEAKNAAARSFAPPSFPAKAVTAFFSPVLTEEKQSNNVFNEALSARNEIFMSELGNADKQVYLDANLKEIVEIAREQGFFGDKMVEVVLFAHRQFKNAILAEWLQEQESLPQKLLGLEKELNSRSSDDFCFYV